VPDTEHAIASPPTHTHVAPLILLASETVNDPAAAVNVAATVATGARDVLRAARNTSSMSTIVSSHAPDSATPPRDDLMDRGVTRTELIVAYGVRAAFVIGVVDHRRCPTESPIPSMTIM
jgi:hypothetical protein